MTFFKTFFKAFITALFFISLCAPAFYQDTVVASLGSAPSVVSKVVHVGSENTELEQPLHDVDLPDFASIISIKKKKQLFFNFLKPAIEQENQKVLAERRALVAILDKFYNFEPITSEDEQLMARFAEKYKVRGEYKTIAFIEALLERIDVMPKALILVQAANESAWGTSRFAKIGLNFFGIWCFRPNCGMVPSGRDGGKKHEVAAFPTVAAAVKRYLYNINTNPAYRELRHVRADIRIRGLSLAEAADELVVGLMPYSERGQAYIDEIRDMLAHNQQYFN